MKRIATLLLIALIVAIAGITSCDIKKLSKVKEKDIEFTVVAGSEVPKQVKDIIEERKDKEFKITYSDEQYTYIVIGYGEQKYPGYSIKVDKLYQTKNAIYVSTTFQGPKEYNQIEKHTYPNIVIKIEYTDKNIVFSE